MEELLQHIDHNRHQVCDDETLALIIKNMADELGVEQNAIFPVFENNDLVKDVLVLSVWDWILSASKQFHHSST